MTLVKATETRGMNVGERKRRFAETVRAMRTERKLSQATLAKEANVDIKTIQRIEGGAMLPNLAMVWDLADVFKVTVPQVLGEEPRPLMTAASAGDLAEKVLHLEAVLVDTEARLLGTIQRQERLESRLSELEKREAPKRPRVRKVG